MDAQGFLYAAGMTDQLARFVDAGQWETALNPVLGSPRQLFQHMVRVRGVYRSGLMTGLIQLPGKFPEPGDWPALLSESGRELAEAFENPYVDRVVWGDQTLTPEDLYAIAVQHEGIHQGQWYMALKLAGLKVPDEWQYDWSLT